MQLPKVNISIFIILSGTPVVVRAPAPARQRGRRFLRPRSWQTHSVLPGPTPALGGHRGQSPDRIARPPKHYKSRNGSILIRRTTETSILLFYGSRDDSRSIDTLFFAIFAISRPRRVNTAGAGVVVWTSPIASPAPVWTLVPGPGQKIVPGRSLPMSI